MTKELAETTSVSVKVSQDGVMKEIKWKDVDIDNDAYIMKLYPSALLPTQPAARLQTVVEMIQAGFYDKETGMDLLDFPDIKAVNSMMTSPRKIVIKILEKMIEDGVYESPEPYMNLQLAQSLGQQKYLEAKLAGVEEENLELLRRWIDDCQALISIAQAPQPPLMMPQQPAQEPMAVPQAPPRSDILPIA